MRRLFIPLTDEEFTAIKAAAAAKKLTVTSLVRKALKLPVAKRGRPAKDHVHEFTKGIAKDDKG